MERCPNCSTPARHGARFCTTCGFRFDGGEEGSTSAEASVDSAPDHAKLANDPVNDEHAAVGWPTTPTPTENNLQVADPSSGESAAAEPVTDAESSTDYVGFWPEPSSDPWPSPVTTSSEADEQADSGPEASPQIEAAPTGSDPIDEAGHTTQSRETIIALLDQLRDAIGKIDLATSPDLSGVISDLEVAVTPPGALPADEVAELREALFTARERPRDIDTIVDLTKRIDTLVALVIAYDRAIAAIERSLAALKRAEPAAETIGPSPTAF
jgi:hypothetical protein